MSAQDRFDRARGAMAAAEDATPYEYDIDATADRMRIARDGDTYSWSELPEHVRDYWRDEAGNDRGGARRG